MKTNNKNRRKQFLALCLSAMMASSAMALVACNDNTTDGSTNPSAPTAQEKEGTLIKNGNFENFAFDAESSTMQLIGTSVSSWTKNQGKDASNTSAPTSKSASGIISTKEEDWKQFSTTEGVDVTTLSEKDAESKWDTLSAKDKLLYMENWKEKNSDKKIAEELDFYQTASIDSDDLPTCENPKTHDGAADSNVLMIHNDYPTYNDYNSIGTAQYYTSSSSVTLKAGTAAKLSLWVKTSDLKMATSDQAGADAINKGAYIELSNTVGEKTMPTFKVENIDTDEWKQYTFYVHSSTFADTTFTLNLGLGQGGSDDRLNHVNGYAFFDDIECEIIPASEYVFDEKEEVNFFNETILDEEQTIDAGEGENEFYLNFDGKFDPVNNNIYTDLKFSATTEEKNQKTYTFGTNKYVEEGWTLYNGVGVDMSEDVLGVYTTAKMAEAENEDLKKVYEKYFKDDKFVGDDKVIMLMSAKGAPSVAKSSYTFTVKDYTILSFYVKTSDVKSFTGASITLNDGAAKNTITSINTTSMATVDTANDKDILDGWQQCVFYVKNETGKESATFTLDFNYGLTSIIGSDVANCYSGFAAFTKFEVFEEPSESVFELATDSTLSKIVSLTAAKEEEVEGTGFDVVSPTSDIENGFAAPKNYTALKDDKGNSGLLNKKYANNYEIVNKLGGWEKAFGNAKQPLVINNVDGGNAYVGAKTTISANTYTTVALQVKVSEGAKATVSLLDMSEDGNSQALSVSRITSYFYDEEGNVCSKDPTSHSFNSKKHVAFKLQANGLYKLNENWENYNKVDASIKDAYFANLANYEVEKDTNNLLVAKDGVTYAYNEEKAIHEGNNGIAYYAYNEAEKFAYTTDKKDVKVLDFSKANLEARHAKADLGNMQFTVENTNGKWVTISFYIHTGDVAKEYCLKVSSEGNANSFAAFDAYTPDTVDEATFNSLVDEKKKGSNYYEENAFSFFDSAKYLRFTEEESVNVDQIVYPYASYNATTHESGVAYLRYVSENKSEYQIYANYGLSDITVAQDAVEDDTTEEEDDDHEHSDTNIWLLISSIAIAAVLLLAMVSIIVQKAIRSYKKKNGIYTKKVKKTKKDNTDK